MTKRVTGLVIGCAVVLFGCATGGRNMHQKTMSQSCDSSPCKIDVVVSGTPPHVDVQVPDKLLVKKNLHDSDGKVLIKWHLVTSGHTDYEFRADSIQFTQGIAKEQFTDVGVQGQARKEYHVKDANSDENEYRYFVKVYVRGSDDWYPSDPFIWNGR
jgi:hypothetical protein